ncbi:MAG: hypothetical protein GEU87_21800 [Alphaproteobacteria bacterium]|nr:hypothetical protein [Alphaproteobacteria bacterium]
MTRRTRRRRAALGAAAAIGGAAVTTWTGYLWAGAIAAVTILAVGHIPTRRRRPRQRPRHRQPSRRAHNLEHTPNVLYRAYNHGGDLLYIGICVTHPGRDIHHRIREHARTQPWWPQVAHVDACEHHPTRSAARAAEETAIEAAAAAASRYTTACTTNSKTPVEHRS